MMKKQARILFLFLMLALFLAVTALVTAAAGNYEVGANTYSTLTAAVSAVPNGGTIRLTGAVTEPSAVALNINKSYILDFGDHTITFGGSDGLTITAGDVTVLSGVFKTANTSCNLINVKGPATVTIKGGRFVGGRTQLNLANSGGATVFVSGTAIFGADGVSVSRALINSNNGSFDSHNNPKKEDTLYIYDGTFHGYRGSSHGIINGAGCNIYISGGTFMAPADSAKPILHLGDGDNTSDVKISGGTFTHAGSGHIVNYNSAVSGQATATEDRPAGSLHVSGGNFYAKGTGCILYFTTSKDRDKLPVVTISNGLFDGRGGTNTLITAAAKGGTLKIESGTFIGDEDDVLLSVGQTKDVQIAGGSFAGGLRQLEIYSASDVTITGNAVFGVDFSGDRLISLSNGADVLGNGDRNAVLTVWSGTFTVTGKTVATEKDGEMEETPTGEVMFHCGGGEIVIEGGTFAFLSDDTTGTVAQRMFSMVDNDITSTLRIKGGTFTTSSATEAILYHGARIAAKRAEGSKGAKGLGAIFISGNPVFNAAAGGRVLDIATGKLYPLAVSISGGRFESGADCVIRYTNPCPESTLTITGGTFILLPGSGALGGAVLRTDIEIYTSPDDPTVTYFSNRAAITASGGLFVDQRVGSAQIFDLRIGSFPLSLEGAVLISAKEKPYFVMTADGAGDIPMSVCSATCLYGGTLYYLYTSATPAATAPLLNFGAEVRATKGSEGLRFTSAVPAAVVAALEAKGAVTYGTLIAPADYVAAAGGFTVEALTAYAVRKGYADNTDKIFVDVVARASIVHEADGSISFNGALVNVKEGNRNRNFAAISYAKVGDLYYYSRFNLADHARSMAEIAEAALKDVSSVASAAYAIPSVYDAEAYSRYTTEQQNVLQSFCGLAPLTLRSVNLSSYRVVCGSDASANCAALANALGTKLGIPVNAGGVQSLEILIGSTDRPETAEALARIEGEGYYIGVIGDRVVLVGTTNALTMMAVKGFIRLYGSGTVTVREVVASHLTLHTIGGDTAIVFPHTIDGDIKTPTGTVYNYKSLFKNHAYASETNPHAVDYPMAAAAAMMKTLIGTEEIVYATVPDLFAVGGCRIHVGITDGAASYLREMGNDVNAYGYSISGGEIIITSYNDQTLRRAMALFLADMADFATTDGAGNRCYRIPAGYEARVVENNGSSDWITDVPLPSLALSGSIDVHDNSYQYYYTGEGVNVAAYDAYCNTLVAGGYRLYSESKVEDSIFRIYLNATATRTVYAAYSAYKHADGTLGLDNDLSAMFAPAIRVIVGRLDGVHLQLLEEKLLRPQTDYVKVTDTKITSMQMKVGNIGNCYIITLEDGSFVVMDGGDNNQNDYDTLWNVLSALHREVHGTTPSRSDPIRLAAYFLSHGHGDHYTCFYQFASKYRTQIVIERVIANFPSNDEIYNGGNSNPTLRNQIGTDTPLDWIRDQRGDVPYYKVHTGQRFYLRNVEFEVLYTHEDIYPWNLEVFNETTTVIRTKIQGTDGNGNLTGNSTTALWFGDAQFRASQCMRATFGSYLKSDMVQVAHHGGNGVEGEIYELVNAKYIWWPCLYSTIESAAKGSRKANRYLLDRTDWSYIVIHDEYNVTVTFKNGLPDFSLAGLQNVADTADRYGNDGEDGVHITYGKFVLTPETLRKIVNP